MTRAALHALSLQNYRENPHMRAGRDGQKEQGRKELSGPARIAYGSLRDAIWNNFVGIKIPTLFFQNERCKWTFR